jgi:uncharacterized protein (DUF2236 family)
MAQRSLDEDPGLFGPDSMIWRINREAAVTLGGTCAVLMQFAHPKVAAGVRDHSSFQDDPAGRLRRTFDLTLAWVFGSRAQAIQAVRIVNRRHDEVRGPGYSARDPALLMWVQATLVYSAIKAYRSFVGPLTEPEADQYYQDTKEIGVLLGIPREFYPAALAEFEAYISEMMESGEVTVRDDAFALGWTVLQPRFPGVPRMALTPLRTITAGLLPVRLREQYRLRWGRRERATFAACTVLLPHVMRIAPSRVRYLPPARQAYRRLRWQPA